MKLYHRLYQRTVMRQDSHIPPLVFQALFGRPPAAIDAIVAFPEMMHQLLKQVLYGDRHASLKLLKGYFVSCQSFRLSFLTSCGLQERCLTFNCCFMVLQSRFPERHSILVVLTFHVFSPMAPFIQHAFR